MLIVIGLSTQIFTGWTSNLVSTVVRNLGEDHMYCIIIRNERVKHIDFGFGVASKIYIQYVQYYVRQ